MTDTLTILSPLGNFMVGGIASQTLISLISASTERGFLISETAVDALNHGSFETSACEKAIKVIALSPPDFECDHELTVGELHDPDWLVAWSKRNAYRLPEGFDALVRLPEEAPPRMRLDYHDQPPGILYPVTELIFGSDNKRLAFKLRSYSDRRRTLEAFPFNPNEKVPDTRCFLYGLREAS